MLVQAQDFAVKSYRRRRVNLKAMFGEFQWNEENARNLFADAGILELS
jgi:hypothetical protein